MKYIQKRKIKDKIFQFFCFLALFFCCFLLLFIIARIFVDASVVFFKPALLIESNNVDLVDEKFLKNFIAKKNTNWNEKQIRKIYNNLFLIKSNVGEIYPKSDQKYTKIPLNFTVKKILQNENSDQLLREFLHLCRQKNLLKSQLNISFLSNRDSINPEIAGIFSSFIGTVLVMLVYIICSVPMGICTAIYSVFFLNSRKLRHILLFNIFNLASLPPVVYGLISLFIFHQCLAIPRSSALIGGLTISLISFPHIVIISKQALRAIPKEIFLGALALGASKTQAIFDHMLPAALPQIFSGIMLGIVRVISETAPLIIVGMVVFSANSPQNLIEPTNTITTQIFLWSKMKNEYFLYLSSAAILVLIFTITVIKVLTLIILKKFSRFHE